MVKCFYGVVVVVVGCVISADMNGVAFGGASWIDNGFAPGMSSGGDLGGFGCFASATFEEVIAVIVAVGVFVFE